MKKNKLKYLFFENWSYKIIAFLIALILWFTILGRRDFVTSVSLDIDLMPGAGRVVVSQSNEEVKLKLSGPRTAIKKFTDSAINNTISIDVSDRSEGKIEVDVPVNRLEMPLGLKVISIKPSSIRAIIAKKEILIENGKSAGTKK